jgi:mannitol/fructose-specific phosphotransferase system IIA component
MSKTPTRVQWAVLTRETILLGAQATDKVDAIRQSGEVLGGTGYAAPSYVDGMLAREKVISTYLGNGIAIPHGPRDNSFTPPIR